MKTAIYMEDGTTQLVITPETDFEKEALSNFSKSISQDERLDVKIYSGSFYDCRGGWIRQRGYFTPGIYEGTDNNDESIILRIKKKVG